jgi:hypothetical protein
VGNGRSAVATPKREERPAESRWSARRKADAVVRLLRGASLTSLAASCASKHTGCRRGETSSWPAASKASRLVLCRRRDRRLKEAERKIGELTLDGRH